MCICATLMILMLTELLFALSGFQIDAAYQLKQECWRNILGS